jgi:BetI-type transcriptional repressor, C-terminal
LTSNEVFRVHAARDPDLSRRYAALHARTRHALAEVITGIYRRAGQPPPSPAQEMAHMMLTVEAGIRVEQAAEPEGPKTPAAFDRLRSFLESPLPR